MAFAVSFPVYEFALLVSDLACPSFLDSIIDRSCHVADHIHAGMIASYHVKANASQPDITWTIAMADKEYVPELPESTTVLWDVSACCSEESNPFFQVLNALVGWRSVGTVATVTTYFVYWAVVLGVWFLLWYIPRRRAMAAKKQAEAEEDLEAGKAVASNGAGMDRLQPTLAQEQSLDLAAAK